MDLKITNPTTGTQTIISTTYGSLKFNDKSLHRLFFDGTQVYQVDQTLINQTNGGASGSVSLAPGYYTLTVRGPGGGGGGDANPGAGPSAGGEGGAWSGQFTLPPGPTYTGYYNVGTPGKGGGVGTSTEGGGGGGAGSSSYFYVDVIDAEPPFFCIATSGSGGGGAGGTLSGLFDPGDDGGAGGDVTSWRGGTSGSNGSGGGSAGSGGLGFTIASLPTALANVLAEAGPFLKINGGKGGAGSGAFGYGSVGGNGSSGKVRLYTAATYGGAGNGGPAVYDGTGHGGPGIVQLVCHYTTA